MISIRDLAPEGTNPRSRNSSGRFTARLTLEQRFYLYVAPMMDDRGCWEWMGWIRNKQGYGGIMVDGIKETASRVSWTLHQGPIPIGFHVLHRCDNPICVNPGHLFLGLHRENMDDMNAKRRNANTKKTHCSNGHPFDEANTYHWNHPAGIRRKRTCRRCVADATARNRAKKRASK